MTKKIASTAVCALALFVTIGCSSTKTAGTANPAPAGNTDKTSNNNATASTDQKLPPVAEAPQAPHRAGWGSNISPYFN